MDDESLKDEIMGWFNPKHLGSLYRVALEAQDIEQFLRCIKELQEEFIDEFS